eukprot:scaffold618581_cov20-Prasinocladus_malaysianus.AAC.1
MPWWSAAGVQALPAGRAVFVLGAPVVPAAQLLSAGRPYRLGGGGGAAGPEGRPLQVFIHSTLPPPLSAS